MHTYEVDLKWTGRSKGILSSSTLPQIIEVAIPSDFPKGIVGVWSPEHLFVAAINSCLMTTFLTIAENSKLHFTSFDCKSICNIDLIDGKNTVTEIILQPRVVIPYSQKPDRAKRIIEMSEKACLISNVIKPIIRLDIKVIVEHDLTPIGDLL
jgi:organic hydroperoxide reductase OsmC/OhrA